MASAAIYYQKSKVVQEEFKLIELTTIRELYVEQLKVLIDAIKEERKKEDEETTLQQFTLFNKIRMSTIELIKAISIWQESFTKPIRPQLMECDYIIVKMLKYIDIVNGSKLKRTFNFQFFRGNALLLPFPNPKTIQPIKVSPALGEQIHAFANPNEEEITFCYQFLINCLPDDVYANRLVSINKWLIESWMPRVWISDAVARLQRANTTKIGVDTSTASGKPSVLMRNNTSSKSSTIQRMSSSSSKLGQSPTAAAGQGNKNDGGTTNNLPAISAKHNAASAVAGASNVLLVGRSTSAGRNRLISINSGTNKLISSLTINTQSQGSDRRSSEAETPKSTRMSIVSMASKSSQPAASSGGGNHRSTVNSVGQSPAVLSRKSSSATTVRAVSPLMSSQKTSNAHSPTAGLRKQSNANSSPVPGSRKNSTTPKATAAPTRQRRNQLLRKEADKILTITGNHAAEIDHKEHEEDEGEKEIELTEAEKRELEKLDLYYKEMENLFMPKFNRRAVQTMVLTGEDTEEANRNTDFKYKAEKMFFLHTNQATTEMLNKAVKGNQSEKFKRTEGNLIAKRNRIIADRNASLADNKKQYTSNSSLYSSGSRPTSAARDGTVDDDEEHLRKLLAKEESDDEEEGDEQDDQHEENLYGEHVSVHNDDSETGGNEQDSGLTRDKLAKLQKQRSSLRIGMRRQSSSRRMSDLSVSFSVTDMGTARTSSVDANDTNNHSAASTRPNSAKTADTVDSVTGSADYSASGGTASETGGKSPLSKPSPLKRGVSITSFGTSSSVASSENTGYTPKAALERSGSSKQLAKGPRVKAIADFKISTAEMRVQFMRGQQQQQQQAKR